MDRSSLFKCFRGEYSKSPLFTAKETLISTMLPLTYVLIRHNHLESDKRYDNPMKDDRSRQKEDDINGFPVISTSTVTIDIA